MLIGHHTTNFKNTILKKKNQTAKEINSIRGQWPMGKAQRKTHPLSPKNINSSCLNFALRNIKTKC